MSSVRSILDVVSAVYDVPTTEILSARRTDPVVSARHAVMYLARKRTTLSLPAIGRILRRDHTTVWHGVRQVEDAAPDARIQLAEAMLDRIAIATAAAGSADREIDVVAVATRVLTFPHTAVLVSVDEIRALALAALPPVQADRDEEDPGADAEAPAPDPSAVIAAARTAIAAARTAAQASHTINERPARAALDSAHRQLAAALDAFDDHETLTTEQTHVAAQ